jgi:HD-GYP domain-containing protein (c-di-GMP phosphodiesterase class II)
MLTVDAASGEILFTEKPKKKGLSFEDAINDLQREKDTADDRFRDAFAKESSRLKSIEGKFQEALKRKDELEDAVNPLDFD